MRNFLHHYFLKTQFLFYFLIMCYEIHVKLIHINFRWIETIIYRVILNEMFVCNFLIHVSCLDFVEMFKCTFRNFWFVYMLKYDECFVIFFQFTCSNLVEMFAIIRISQLWSCLYVRDLIFSYVSIRIKCFDNWFIFRFRFLVAY